MRAARTRTGKWIYSATFSDFSHRSYFLNVQVRTGGEYGNAILSRFPLTETSNIDVTVPPKKKRRSILHGRYRIRLNGALGKHTRTLHLYNLHLGLSGIERKIQLRKFLESHPFVGLHHRTPIVVAGDFNDIWGTLGKKLLDTRGVHRARSTGAHVPRVGTAPRAGLDLCARRHPPPPTCTARACASRSAPRIISR